MTAESIGSLFAKDISRRIEEVIKVDQTDEDVIGDEIAEYVITDSIRSHYDQILDRYWETPKKPHEGIAVWVSGFFGSGKSSFAKFLGLALENRSIKGDGAAKLFGERAGSSKTQVLLNSISEQLPTHAVIFDVSTDRGIRTGNQTVTEIMYRLFLQSLGYARDLDLAELEITLEGEGRLEQFKDAYRPLFHKEWDEEKRKIVLAVQQASRVMHDLDVDTYRIPSPVEDDWERQRLSLGRPKPAEEARILEDIVKGLWQPQPVHNFLQTKIFKAGLSLNGRQLVEGDVPFHLALADEGNEHSSRLAEMRTRSQGELKSVFWVAALSQDIDRDVVELHRSQEMIKLKERSAQTRDESALVAEEYTDREQAQLLRRLRRCPRKRRSNLLWGSTPGRVQGARAQLMHVYNVWRPHLGYRLTFGNDGSSVIEQRAVSQSLFQLFTEWAR
jgi:hypothetical protein